MSNSADGSVNGKYDGPQPGREVAAEVGLGEPVDGAGQVGERDAPVDDQALDLVEHRQVGGIGGVLAERAAGHDRVDGRRLGLHDPDLDRRGVGAQQGASGLAEVDVERVVHVACRVALGEVEGLEVVEVGLDLGPLGHGEAEADEDVLELHDRLGDQVEVPAAGSGEDLGEVEPLGFEPLGARGLLEVVAPLVGQSGSSRWRR